MWKKWDQSGNGLSIVENRRAVRITVEQENKLMTVKPRTIDNLGVDASIRYAKDQELLEPRLIEESRLIPQKTEVTVVKPFELSEFDQTYSVGRTISWALFSPPPDFYARDKGLFSYQLIPSLGGYEKLEADSDKIETLEDVLEKSEEREGRGQSDQEREKDENQRQTLLALFQCIDKLNKTLAMINARRNQYQRG